VNNTVRIFERIFEEAFTRLNRFTKCTPLVKLEKETGELYACALARSPRLAEGVRCECARDRRAIRFLGERLTRLLAPCTTTSRRPSRICTAIIFPHQIYMTTSTEVLRTAHRVMPSPVPPLGTF
jgi:hypothetical protein